MPGFITLYKVRFIFLAGGWDKTPEGLMLKQAASLDPLYIKNFFYYIWNIIQ